MRMGLTPGPRFGRILEHLLDRVLENPEANRRETLEEMVEEYLARESEMGEAAPGEGSDGSRPGGGGG